MADFVLRKLFETLKSIDKVPHSHFYTSAIPFEDGCPACQSKLAVYEQIEFRLGPEKQPQSLEQFEKLINNNPLDHMIFMMGRKAEREKINREQNRLNLI